MYQQRDALEGLIRSMDSSEKRYFKLFCGSDSPNPSPLYMNLYAHIEKGNSELSRAFKKNRQTLTTTRKRLYRIILSALRSMHDSQSVDIVLQNTLSEIEILYNMGLPQQGAIKIGKAFALAATHEKFGLMLQVLDWEKRLNAVLDKATRTANEIQLAEQSILAKMTQIMHLEGLYSTIRTLKRSIGYARGTDRERLEQEVIHKLPASVTACLSNKAIFYYHIIHAIYHWMIQEHTRAFDESQRLLSPVIQFVLPDVYVDGLLEHVTSAICIARFDNALRSLDAAEDYVARHKLNQSHAYVLKLFAYKAVYKIIAYAYMGDRKKLMENIHQVEGQLGTLGQSLSFDLQMAIQGNLMNAYVALGDMDQADKLWSSLFNRKSQAVRKDIYADLYLFRLFSLLQSRNYEIIPPAALSALRYYRKDNQAAQFPLEIRIASILNKMHRYEDRKIRKHVLAEMKQALTGYIKGLNPKLCFQEHYSRYVIWCDSLSNGTTYGDEAAKWYEQIAT